MKHSVVFSLTLILVLSLFSGCSDKDAATDLAPPTTEEAAAAPAVDTFTGEVVETMNAGGYTYVLIDTGDEQIWAATNEFPVEVGDRLTVPKESPMANFHSQSLDRDFEIIYFASRIVPEGTPLEGGMVSPHGGMMGGAMGGDAATMGGDHTAAPVAGIEAGSIEVPEGGLTVEQIWADREELSGKTITVRGKVVKYNPAIMGTNWLHIQDGTGDPAAGTNDLTVTTAGEAAVGDIVTVSGTLTLDKDFGYGYRYDAIILDATVTKE